MATIKDLLSNMISKIHTKMDKLAVTESDEGKVLGVENGAIGLVDAPSSIPETDSAYMQLVTNGDGQTEWTERLGYTDIEAINSIGGSDNMVWNETDGVYTSQTITNLTSEIVIGQVYVIRADGKKTVAVAKKADSLPCIGNTTIAGFGEDTGEQFLFVDGTRYGMGFVVYSKTKYRLFDIAIGTATIHHIPDEYLHDASDSQKGVIKVTADTEKNVGWQQIVSRNGILEVTNLAAEKILNPDTFVFSENIYAHGSSYGIEFPIYNTKKVELILDIGNGYVQPSGQGYGFINTLHAVCEYQQDDTGVFVEPNLALITTDDGETVYLQKIYFGSASKFVFGGASWWETRADFYMKETTVTFRPYSSIYEGYLPDGVPVVHVTDADNGKILGVVDGTVGLVEQESGLPSDVGAYKYMATDGEGKWVAEDRLAYKDTKQIVIEWDGNATDPENIVTSPLGDQFYRVSEDVFSEAEIKAGKITFSNGYTGAISEMWDAVISGDGFIGNLPDLGIVFVSKDNTKYDVAVTFQKAGVYLYKTNNGFVTRFETSTETITPIPAEYIPRIVFTAESAGYTCNVPHAEFKNAISNGLPIIYVDKRESIPMLDSAVSVSGQITDDSGEIEWFIYIFNVPLFENDLTLKYTANGITKYTVA